MVWMIQSLYENVSHVMFVAGPRRMFGNISLSLLQRLGIRLPLSFGEDKEEIVKPDRIGTMDKEILRYKSPTGHQKEQMRRVFEIELWIQRKGWVEEEEIVVYAINRWDVKRETALEYKNQVIQAFEQRGLTRGRR